MKRTANLEKKMAALTDLLRELVQDSLTTVSVTRKDARIFCQTFQNFPISKYNQIYLQLKASLDCIDSFHIKELNQLQNELILNCNELLNALTVGNGRSGCTMANILLEVRCMSELIIRQNLKSGLDLDYERSIGLSKIRRLHFSESLEQTEGYSIQF